MSCSINWNILSFSEWEQRFNKISCSTILQSYGYALATCLLNRQKARWGLIEIDGQEAGLVQIIETGVFRNSLHAIMIDRGPLWFQGFGEIAHFESVVKELSRQFPRRIGRRRRFIPEMQDNEEIRTILKTYKFKRQNSPGYQTLSLDLTQDLDVLRAAFKGKWRGWLNKAERQNLTVEWEDPLAHLPWLLKVYAVDKQTKNYDGPSLKLMQALAKIFDQQKNLLIARALIDKKVIGAILVLCHGQSATYQIGWTSGEGRGKGAHHLLLWQALQALKQRGITDFDLGGVNDEDAKGVKTFKQGTGGRLVALPGLYT